MAQLRNAHFTTAEMKETCWNSWLKSNEDGGQDNGAFFWFVLDLGFEELFYYFSFLFFFTFEITTATMNNNETDNKYVYFSVKGRQLLLLFFVLSSANWLYRIEWDQLIIVEWNCLSSPLSLDEDRFWLILFGWIVGVSWKLFPVEFNEQLISDWIDPLIWTVSFVAANCFVWSLSGRGPGAGKGGGREGLTELS